MNLETSRQNAPQFSTSETSADWGIPELYSPPISPRERERGRDVPQEETLIIGVQADPEVEASSHACTEECRTSQASVAASPEIPQQELENVRLAGLLEICRSAVSFDLIMQLMHALISHLHFFAL